MGDHYTLKCPYRDVMASVRGESGATGEGTPLGGMDDGEGGRLGSGGPGHYVPPAARGGGGGGGGAAGGGAAGAAADAASMMPAEELRRLRIGNLAEDVEEDDIRELVAPYGHVERVSLSRHRDSNKVTAAYVTFMHHDEAERARKDLDGVGFRYLLLKVEWAKPNLNKDFLSGSQGLSGGFVSGYGKALPQKFDRK